MTTPFYRPSLALLAVLGSACTLETSGAIPIEEFDAGSSTGGGGSDAATADSETTSDGSLEVGPEDTGPPGCPLEGVFALQISAQVSWEAKRIADIFTVIEEGTDNLDMVVLVELDRSDNVLEGELQVCGAQVPTFESTLAGESYGVVFKDETWLAPTMPRVPVRVDLQCPDAGCGITVPPVTVMLGVEMPDPTAPWPNERTELSYPDHDYDGYGGVTLETLGPDAGGTYQYPPTSYDLVFIPARADQLMLGIRVNASLSGMLDSCTEMSGQADRLTIDTHAASCTLAGSGTTCDAEQATFVDGNLPQWEVDSATFTSVLLGEEASCAEARAQF